MNDPEIHDLEVINLLCDNLAGGDLFTKALGERAILVTRETSRAEEWPK